MKRTALAALTLLVAINAGAAVRFTYEVKNAPVPIAWPANTFPIHYTVSNDLVTQLPGATASIEQAAHDWSTITGSRVTFADDGAANVQAGRDGKNVISLNDKLFETSGFLAFTTTFSDDSGTIEEADIQIDTSAARSQASLAPVIEHELGHVLGLDHSPVVSAVMFPYISPDGLARLDSDDKLAIAAIYPTSSLGNGTATLHGTLRRLGAPLFGAQVVALNSTGEPVAATLSDAEGRYELTELPPDSYRLYAEPLDGPVEPKNLSGAWHSDAAVLFRTGFLTPAAIHAAAGAVIDTGEVEVDASDPTLNPRWIGTVNANGDVQLASTASHLRAGDDASIAVGGDGFVSGMTQFDIANSGFVRISDFQYGPNYVWAKYHIASTTPLESTVVFVHNGAETAALTGAIYIDSKTRARLVR